jgi:hypothetical protein
MCRILILQSTYVGILSLHSGSPVSCRLAQHEAPLSTMQLGLASAAAIRSGASDLQPAGSDWLVSRTAAPTRGRQYELQFKREPPTKQAMGEGKYRQPCVTVRT